ncbi:sigma-54-dependent Fis family transcriptional regulator [bacterium]|nr:sigma-54-dependent Fis family transcriptional regulator [candidate division CSSED10-310 bacterium]
MTLVAREKTRLLVKIVEDLSIVSEEATLIRELIRSALEFTGAARGFLARINDEGNTEFFDASGERLINLEISHSVLNDVFASGRPVCLIQNADGRSMPTTASILSLDLKSIMACPMHTRTGEAGSPTDAVLYVDSQIVSRPFDRWDLDFFSILAQHTAAVWRNLLLNREMETGFKLLHEEVRSKFDYHKIVGKCETMQKVYEILEILRSTDLDVLITGDTGTGKELIAKAIHYSSNRSDKPLKQINCAALPEGLVEAEIFGVEKNVATEVKSRRGMIEQADGGTLFLDEIGDMPLRIQNRLLHFLETRKYRRIGGREETAADVRVLAATNKVLTEEIKTGRFRDALRYRLEIIPIHLPPLKERGNDLQLLAEFFLSDVVERNSLKIKGFTNDAWELMHQYDWPGNVRELKHRIQSAAFLTSGSLIQRHDLGIHVPGDLRAVVPLAERRDSLEQQLVRRALERHGFRVRPAAEELRISPTTLRRKAAKYRIDEPRE